SSCYCAADRTAVPVRALHDALPIYEAVAARNGDASPEAVVRACPRDSQAWADLAESALSEGQEIQAYAFARTGYHRGLDLLRGRSEEHTSELQSRFVLVCRRLLEKK